MARKRKPDPIDDAFICVDCSVSTLHNDEYYMVTDEVWTEAHMPREGMLCIGCLEGRLGRTLSKRDFANCPLNTGDWCAQSERLIKRLHAARSYPNK